MAIARIISRYAATVVTTDATPTTLLTIPLATASRVILAEGNVVGKNSTPQLTTWRLLASFRNVAGTVSQEGATDTLHEKAGAPLASADVNYVVSGTNVLVQVTGVAATTIEWFGTAIVTEN